MKDRSPNLVSHICNAFENISPTVLRRLFEVHPEMPKIDAHLSRENGKIVIVKNEKVPFIR